MLNHYLTKMVRIFIKNIMDYGILLYVQIIIQQWKLVMIEYCIWNVVFSLFSFELSNILYAFALIGVLMSDLFHL